MGMYLEYRTGGAPSGRSGLLGREGNQNLELGLKQSA